MVQRHIWRGCKPCGCEIQGEEDEPGSDGGAENSRMEQTEGVHRVMRTHQDVLSTIRSIHMATQRRRALLEGR